MSIGNVVGWIVLILLALYGCAQIIRRLCLWLFQCPGCALCCRLAVPQDRTALAPLARCLQSQTVWESSADCQYTLMLLPDHPQETARELDCIFSECPSVIPVTFDGLQDILQQLTRSENRDGTREQNRI